MAIVVGLSIAANAANFTSTQSGSWGSPATWGGAGIPGAADDVTIATGTTVTLDQNRTSNNLTINNGGTLDLNISAFDMINTNTTFTNNGTLTGNAGTLFFNGSGAPGNFIQAFAGAGTYSANISVRLVGGATVNVLPSTSMTFSTASNNDNIIVFNGSVLNTANALTITAPASGANYVVANLGTVNGAGGIRTNGNVEVRVVMLNSPVEVVSGSARGFGTFNGNLTIDSGASLKITAPTDVGANLNILSGATLDLNGFSLDSTGNGATFTNNGSVINTGAFNTFNFGASSLGFTQHIATSTGTFSSNILLRLIQGVTVVLDGSVQLSNILMLGGTTLRSLSSGTLTLSGDVGNGGTIQFNGGGSFCGDAGRILIRSSVPGTQRLWSGVGTFSMTDVNVMDQAGSAAINVIGGVNSGNNGANWSFAPCTPGPPLGNYPNATVTLGADTTVTPSSAPTGATSINISSNSNFKVTFAANPTTGVVRITNAHPAGSYPVTVRAFNAAGGMTARTFTLTVTNGTACAGQPQFTAVPNPAVGVAPRSVAIGDFNNDGNQDIAFSNDGDSTVGIRLGNGSGGFSGSTIVNVGVRPFGIAVGDFNNDGRQDFATANRNSSSASVRLGDGMGGFTGTTEVPAGGNPESLAIGDVNNDGNQDLAIASLNGPFDVAIRLGNGLGGFSGTTSVVIGVNLRSVVFGDFNNDGILDLAAAGSTLVAIRLGDGSGNFSGTTVVPVSSTGISLGDFNSDGNQDFVSVDVVTDLASVRFGNGTGGFTGTTDIPIGFGPEKVAVGDFNNDGKQDFASANRDGTVSIVTGNGLGGFTLVTNETVGGGTRSVAIGDFNNDGKQDFTTTSLDNSLDADHISVRLGGCPTAARVAISGRVMTPEGRGIRNAMVTLTDNQGVINRALTSARGIYRFDDVEAGHTYILAIRSRRYQFESQVISVTDDLTGVDFIASPSNN